MSPHPRKDQTPLEAVQRDVAASSTTWRLIKEIGGVPIVVAVIIFAARLDANVSKFAETTGELTGVVKEVAAQIRAAQLQRVRDSVVIADHERRLHELEEARRGRR